MYPKTHLLLIASLLISSVLNAQLKGLDKSFGENGKVQTKFSGYTEEAVATAIQPDGKLVMVSTSTGGTAYYQIGITRLNTDGRTDISFGTAGKAIFKSDNADCKPVAVLIQPDKKILVLGTRIGLTTKKMIIARFLQDGSPDINFGSAQGHTFPFFGDGSIAVNMALQPDGKIVIVGNEIGRDAFDNKTSTLTICRINTNGRTDRTFNNRKIDIIGLLYSEAAGVAIQSDAKIVIGGFAGFSFFADAKPADLDRDFMLIRVDSEGGLDKSFSEDGYLLTDITNEEGKVSVNSAYSLALQSDDKILLGGGFINKDKGEGIALARYTKDGELDKNFQHQGLYRQMVSNQKNLLVSKVAFHKGKILVAGNYGKGSSDWNMFVLVVGEKGDSERQTFYEGGLYIGPGTKNVLNDMDVSGSQIYLTGHVDNQSAILAVINTLASSK